MLPFLGIKSASLLILVKFIFNSFLKEMSILRSIVPGLGSQMFMKPILTCVFCSWLSPGTLRGFEITWF